jgi:hypothetical protein
MADIITLCANVKDMFGQQINIMLPEEALQEEVSPQG